MSLGSGIGLGGRGGAGTVCQGILAALTSRSRELLLCFSHSLLRPALRLLRRRLLCILNRVARPCAHPSTLFVFFFSVP